MGDVARNFLCSMGSPTNVTPSFQAPKRAPAAPPLATVGIQKLTVPVIHARTIAKKWKEMLENLKMLQAVMSIQIVMNLQTQQDLT